MKVQTLIFKGSLLTALTAAIVLNTVEAKPYPEETKLAKVQEIVLNNGAEVPSIDPAKQAAEPAFFVLAAPNQVKYAQANHP